MYSVCVLRSAAFVNWVLALLHAEDRQSVLAVLASPGIQGKVSLILLRFSVPKDKRKQAQIMSVYLISPRLGVLDGADL